jgi:hypothetical protein
LQLLINHCSYILSTWQFFFTDSARSERGPTLKSSFGGSSAISCFCSLNGLRRWKPRRAAEPGGAQVLTFLTGPTVTVTSSLSDS